MLLGQSFKCLARGPTRVPKTKKQTVKCFTVLIYFANFFNAILASWMNLKKSQPIIVKN